MSTKVLVVDDKQMMRDSVAQTLQRAGYVVVVAAEGKSALEQVARHRPAAVITDLKMPEMDGLELLTRLRRADDQLPVVLMTAFGSIEDAVRAMKQGAFDFVTKPFEGDQLVLTIRRAVEHRRLLQENEALRSSSRNYEAPLSLIGNSPPMRRLAQQIHQVAQSHGTVLICGESGTGKEVVARTIHAHSPRRDRIMLCLNCAALSSSLLESELFGHEKGAFTGADQLRKGRFELADGGTLLLDEISEISPELQAKLLRVLQEGQFERVGSSLSMHVDVRVIATTNRDLAKQVADGEFRQDLFYRLNVLPLSLPPLRQRLEDVPLLVNHFLAMVAMREGREAKRCDAEALELMKQYTWPGNVRELQNICERASVLSRGQVITAGLLQPWLLTPVPRKSSFEPNELPGAGVRPLEETEREQIIRTLGHFGGNRQKTAEALGIGVRTLGLKLKKWKEQNLVAQTI
ncbi:MAG: sigma-54-dependent Fis family transcriptional regulator [Phycisphaeraceae bacterium]|nr:sigma-54-dependent Fis family transcriptional regulator [Phycisphaeraceae bacterium]